MNVDNKMFVIYIAIWKQEKMLVHSKKQAHVRALLFDEAFTEVLAEYSDYSNIFSAKNAAELLKNIGINEYVIKLEENKQPSFVPIYSLEPVELETLKTYIKINLANDLIRPSKSSAKVSILFDRKSNRSFYFYVDYWSLNNIIIKNCYPLPLIGELMD